MPVKKRKPKIPTKSEFMTRTRNMHHSHEQDLWEQLYGKGATKDTMPSPSKRAKLPWSLDYLRMKADEMLQGDNNDCRWCHCLLTVRNFSLDHLIPWEAIHDHAARFSFAPSPEVGYFAWENLDLRCCKKCNIRKGKLTDVEYRLVCDFLATLPTRASGYVMGKLASVPFKFFSKNKKPEAGREATSYEPATKTPMLFG